MSIENQRHYATALVMLFLLIGVLALALRMVKHNRHEILNALQGRYQ